MPPARAFSVCLNIQIAASVYRYACAWESAYPETGEINRLRKRRDLAVILWFCLFDNNGLKSGCLEL
jgi:hypothetical protein